MSNNNIRKSLIATALAGAVTLVSGVALAASVADITKAGADNAKAQAASQEKVNNIYEQSQELLAEYRALVEQTENLKVYNDNVNEQVKNQVEEIDSLQKQIGTIEGTKQGIIPLMTKMVDTLEAFIKADMPIDLTKRLERVQHLREYLVNPSINTSEQYRLVLDAYKIEKNLGTVVATYTDKLNVDGQERTVNFVYVGRIAFLALSTDDKHAWMWNKKTNAWEELDPEYLESTKMAVRVAGKQAAPELLKLPVFAAE
ncbi:MAG TPA: hypothetical protein DCS87_14095 [Rheinheimera sp.]|nr:hypothetical protein [Rheinheimera sp.]